MTPYALTGALLRALALEASELSPPPPEGTASRLAALALVAESEAPSAIAAGARMASTAAEAWAGAARAAPEWRALASLWHRAAVVLEPLACHRGAEPTPPPVELSARYRWCAAAARGQA